MIGQNDTPNLDIDAAVGVVTSSEFRASVESVVNRLKETQQPMLVTVGGRSGFIALSPELYEKVKEYVRKQSRNQALRLEGNGS